MQLTFCVITGELVTARSSVESSSSSEETPEQKLLPVVTNHELLVRNYCHALNTRETLPAMPSTTKLSLVRVPVLSKQQMSVLPANGIRKGSVQ